MDPITLKQAKKYTDEKIKSVDNNEAAEFAYEQGTFAKSEADKVQPKLAEVDGVLSSANQTIESMEQATLEANQSAGYATEQGDNAKNQASLVESKLEEADQAISTATQSADNANEKAEVAQQKADLVDQKVSEVDEALGGIEEAVTSAEQSAGYASEQGDYAKDQGDIAGARLEELEQVDAVQFHNRQDQFDSQLAQTATKTEVDTKVAQIVSGSPKGTYSTLSALQTAKPTGDTGIYVVQTDGKWYYWNNSSWVEGGTYQSSGIADETITREKLSSDVRNVATYSIKNQLPNIADLEKWSATYSTLSINNGGLMITANGSTSAQSYGRAFVKLNGSKPKVGDKVVFRVKATVLNSDATNIRLLLRDGTGGTILTDQRTPPTNGVEYDLYYLITITNAIANDGLYLMIDHMYSSNTIAVGKQMKVSYALVSNLNEIYSTGFMPTAEEFKAQLDKSLDLFTAKDTYEKLIALENKESEWDVNTTENINSSIVRIDKSPEGVETYKSLDHYKYPLEKVWGHEYLYSWYKRIADEQNLTMTWAGDSTTANTSITNPDYHRNNLAKKIMRLGGYDEAKITSLNRGNGGHHTGDWLVGHLHNDMLENPHMYAFGYGINDGGTNYFPGTTIQQRVEGFEQRLREGLGRIRTNGTFPSGPSYNKSPNELSIILCTPVTTNNPERMRTKEEWHNYIRPVIQKACRDFQCMFVDLAMHQYDRTYNATWSTSGDNVHPNYVSTADYMSVFKDVLIPYTLQK